MANAWYAAGREHFAGGGNWLSGDYRAMLVASSYEFREDHRSLLDIGAADNGRSGPLAGKSIVGGVLDADDASVRADSYTECNALIVFSNAESDADSVPIVYVDTVSAGLPFSPEAGQRMQIAWDNGPNKIARL